jgi:S-adenosyl-L-methionine hydrolase (adenosine-forming)
LGAPTEVRAARPIVFLSDYGLEDEFAGVCRAVLARISPASPVVDLTHSIPPHDVFRGALVLSRAIRYLPSDAVVLAVVDPGVGTGRRPVAIRTKDRERLLVGPDNGLLSLAWAEDGGVSKAVTIESPDVVLEPISATFHGRDVFAPAAAHLASGLALESVGPPVDPSSLVSLKVTDPELGPAGIDCEVLGVDRFGNVQLSARAEHLTAAGLDRALMLQVVCRGRGAVARRAFTFGDVIPGELAVIVDSGGWVAVVVNRGSAAEALGLAVGDPVTLHASG